MRYIFLAAIFFSVFSTVPAQPSANEIVFAGGPNSNGFNQIYSIRADGSGQVNLTNNPAATHLSPSWSPDGTKIVLIKNGRIWVMNADGTNLRELFQGGVEGYSHPVWSPDGSKIAVVFDGHGFDFPSINLVDANGQNFQQIAFSGSFDSIFSGLDWSPNGSKIVFSKRDGDRSNIFVMNADGTGQNNLTNAGVGEFYIEPTWSPNGSKIAFALSRANSVVWICTMNADGSDIAFILNSGPTWGIYHPSWSPDGLRLAFHGFLSGYDEDYSHIFVINADGTNLFQLTQNSWNYAPNWKRAAPLYQLSGRVMTSSNRSVPRARVTLDDGAGNLRSGITNPFGYFRFQNVPTGTYTVSVRSKSYSFTPRTISVSSSLTDLDFVALENP